MNDLPIVNTTATLVVVPLSPRSFPSGLDVQLAIGNSVPYATVGAVRGADGKWTVSLPVTRGTTTSLRLAPTAARRTPYAGIDTGRYFTPPGTPVGYFTTEGVFGMTTRGPTAFAEPADRKALMASAFGPSVVAGQVFGPDELPNGATISGGRVWFVVHAPHAVFATLILVPDAPPGRAVRREIPMALTGDTRYWWCSVPLSDAPAGTRYHFVLNDDLEILDPAAREVHDTGGFDVPFGSDPNDEAISWSVVLDVEAVRAESHKQPWQTMGWESLLVYEIHARRFTDRNGGDRSPPRPARRRTQCDQPLGQAGFCGLPVTAFELLPVQEFNSTISWGYDPSFYFAVDGHYGGSMRMPGS